MRLTLISIFVVGFLASCTHTLPIRESASVALPRPRITAVIPNSGPLTGGNTITLQGSHFQSGARIQIQGMDCLKSFRNSPTQFTCNPRARAAGIYHVRITNPDGQTGVLASGYTYRADPPLIDHGVASPISTAFGTFATTDRSGKNWVSAWLSDHRGCDYLVSIDATTGMTTQLRLPAPRGRQAPTVSLLSQQEKVYALFGGRFFEYDPETRRITFQESIQPENQTAAYWETALGITESEEGLIWLATWPYSNLYSFNPNTRQLMRYGRVNQEQWLQYPGHLATDRSGWVYIGIGTSRSQIVAFNPRTFSPGNAENFIKLLSETERLQGSGFVYSDVDGNVYGLAEGGQRNGWFRLFGGTKTLLPGTAPNRKRPIRSGFQDFIINNFKDGSQLKQLDLAERKLILGIPEREDRWVFFDYETDGAGILGVFSTPTGNICGSTGFPMRLFCFTPSQRSWINLPSTGQANVFAVDGNQVFIGGYPEGSLSSWTPANTPSTLPQPLISKSTYQILRRPHDLLITPDGNSLILAGTPGYGLTGGGLVIWNRKTGTKTEIDHSQLIPRHSTMSFTTLPNHRILGGSTIRAATGGVNQAKEAVLYEWDPSTNQVIWQRPVIPGAHTYSDLSSTPDGKVLGIADGKQFFVFDKHSNALLRNENLQARFGAMSVSEQSQQGPRVFIRSQNGDFYLLIQNGILKINPTTFEPIRIVTTPVPITGGGDFLNGRIYFFSGSHLWSYQPAN